MLESHFVDFCLCHENKGSWHEFLASHWMRMIGPRCRRSILCQILCGGPFDAFVYTAIQAKRFNCAESNPQKWIRNKAGCSRILRNVLCGSIYVNMWWTNNYLQKMSFSFEKWLCSVISLWIILFDFSKLPTVKVEFTFHFSLGKCAENVTRDKLSQSGVSVMLWLYR